MQMIYVPFRREAKLNRESFHQKIVNNTYEARLKRLKEELNGPTVTEIIQMHKFQEKNQTSSNKGNDEIFDEIPIDLQKNATSKQSNLAAVSTGSQPFDRNR